MKVRFEPYDDSVYYDSLIEPPEKPLIEEDFLDLFSKIYQSDKIKLDISVGISLKFVDILNI